MKFDVIVLAGGKGIKGLLNFFQPKALIKLNDKFMIEYVVDSFKQIDNVRKIVIVGDKEKLSKVFKEKEELVILQQEGTMLGNINTALEYLKTGDSRVIITTADIPLITKSAIEDFIEKCKNYEYDFYLPIIKQETYFEKFPKTRRTWVYLQEGALKTGNIFIVNPELFIKEQKRINELISFRKSPLKIFGIVGIIFIIKYIFKILTLKEVERKIKKLTGFDVKAVFSEYPEICLDVDKVSDMDFVKKHISKD